MGKFPVISISLKSIESDTFDGAKEKLCSVIGDEALRFLFLAQSDRLSETDRRQYKKLIELDNKGMFAMSEGLLENSLLMLSRFLHRHYGQKAVILIDEYDVPLDKAYQSGYYDAMVKLIKGLFGQALKTNSSLYFAVLRDASESPGKAFLQGLITLMYIPWRMYSIMNISGFRTGRSGNCLHIMDLWISMMK